MAVQESTGSTRYQKQLEDEGKLADLFFAFSLSGLVLNPLVIVFGIGLWLTSFVRSRVVNHEDAKQAGRTMFVSSPLLIQLSIVITYFTIATIVHRFLPTNMAGQVLAYAGVFFVVSLLVLVIEHWAIGEYFYWWGNRAIEQAGENMDGFWAYVAHQCFKFSNYEPSKSEKRKMWSRQRSTPGPFTPTNWQTTSPTPELSWILTIIAWLANFGHGLAFLTGLLFFLYNGFGLAVATILTSVVFFASSFLSDQIKYFYFYWPLRDGVSRYESGESTVDRSVIEARSHWFSTLLSFVILWQVF